jgi:UDPglucose--hexose-1-phosphate uridylyltransferase
MGDYPYVFTNDTRALSPKTMDDPARETEDSTGLFRAVPAYGECEVVIHHPDHNQTLSTVPASLAVRVFRLWTDRYRELGKRPYVRTVNIFENFLFGSSMRHPHNQIWATSIVSIVQQTMLSNLSAYRKERKDHLLQILVKEELRLRDRVVFENTDFVCIVPFWAEWPFEMMIIPKTVKNSLIDLDETELESFADAYREAVSRLNNLFGADCPYSTGLYQAPTDGLSHDEGIFHLMFRPPVLRDIRTRKWMVGYELMAMIQRDLTPEAAAFLLRNPQGWEDFRDRHISS